MKTVCIIPARWGSTRFPGKPLAPIRGCGGESKSLIERTFEIAVTAQCFESIYVATDDGRIADAALLFGADVIPTSPGCRNGTERVAEAARMLDLKQSDIVVNLQGDSVLTPPNWLSCIASYHQTGGASVSTTVYHRHQFEPPSPGDVEAILDVDFQALYFTRGPIPQSQRGRYQHFGIYGYYVSSLYAYTAMRASVREEAEQLEQLRFLENGYRVQCIQPMGPGGIFPEREVNYPDDVTAVEEVLKQWNIE